MIFINILISATVIGFTVWFAGKRPDLAGFIISLPISTLIALALSQMQYSEDPTKGVLLAKSIFIAIPSTLVFFIPFLLANKLKIPFWVAYGTGIALLIVAYFVHKFIFNYFTR